MKDLYQKLENYYQFEKSDSVFITLFKSILLLTCGGFFGLILRELNTEPVEINWFHILFFLIGISIFTYIEYRRLRKEKNFPVSILQHLNASEELKDLRDKHSRKTKLYDYIDNSIQSLNSNTCPVTFEDDNFLCHQDLEQGLRSVLYDLIERPNYILNIDDTNFTVGTFVKDILDKQSNVGQLTTTQKIFLFRDDLQIAEFLPENPYELNSEFEASFQFQTAILEGLSFNKFICKEFSIGEIKYSLICSPIPNVCENCPPEGIIFCIYKNCEKCSVDIDSVLLIFGRILSNWISRYNDCVRNEKKIKLSENHIHKTTEVPKELTEFLEKQKQNPN